MAEDYLPEIDGTRAADGSFTVQDAGDTFSAVRTHGCIATFWTGVSLFMLVQTFQDGAWFAVFILSIFVAVGLWLFYGTYKRYKVWQRFTPGELTVSPWPLSPGVEGTFRYTRSPRKATRMRYLTARLELEEKVQYQQGTDVRTATHTVWSHPLGERDLSGRNRQAEVDEAFTYQVPKHLPASFHVSRNELNWRLVVDLHYGSGSEDDSNFDLLVTPIASRNVPPV